MNSYVSIINDTLDHIESHIGGDLALSALSRRAGISDFHFNRMFRAVAGITLKQYVLGRKLSHALTLLSASDRSVIDIALELGFEYPEVFSRAFAKQYGLPPAAYRAQRPAVNPVPRAVAVERDIISRRGGLTLKGVCTELEPFVLQGVSAEAEPSAPDFEARLRAGNERFLKETAGHAAYGQDRFYTAVRCSGAADDRYTVFCGRPLCSEEAGREVLTVPGGWYALFEYRGDMFEIREVFEEDLYRWILVYEARLRSCGIGMLNSYSGTYPADDAVMMLVPLEAPPQSARIVMKQP